MEPQRRGQYGELLGDESAKRPECGIGLEPGAHRADFADAARELLRQQADDDAQDVVDQAHPALDPAHRARELDRVGAQRIGRGAEARRLLGVGHHRFKGVELTGQPSGQAVRQQTEGGVALRTVPASNVCPARSLARVGAVAGERTSSLRMLRTALKPCIAPRLGPNPTSATRGQNACNALISRPRKPKVGTTRSRAGGGRTRGQTQMRGGGWSGRFSLSCWRRSWWSGSGWV